MPEFAGIYPTLSSRFVCESFVGGVIRTISGFVDFDNEESGSGSVNIAGEEVPVIEVSKAATVRYDPRIVAGMVFYENSIEGKKWTIESAEDVGRKRYINLTLNRYVTEPSVWLNHGLGVIPLTNVGMTFRPFTPITAVSSGGAGGGGVFVFSNFSINAAYLHSFGIKPGDTVPNNWPVAFFPAEATSKSTWRYGRILAANSDVPVVDSLRSSTVRLYVDSQDVPTRSGDDWYIAFWDPSLYLRE